MASCTYLLFYRIFHVLLSLWGLLGISGTPRIVIQVHTHISSTPHLDDSVVDGRVLLLPQHHQGDDDDGRYDDASHHQPDDGALVRADILGEEHLKRGERKRGTVKSHCTTNHKY